MDRIVLAHSGSFATEVAIPWLAEKYRAEIVAVTVDLGDSADLDAVRLRALGLGAVRAHVIDAVDEFARDFVLPSLHASAAGLSTALAQPVIARHLVEIAGIEGASRIAHGCALQGGDASRLERLVRSLHASAKFIALARRFPAPSVAAYARPHGVAMPAPRAPGPARIPARMPQDAALVDLEFQQGVPVSINGVEMPLVELMQSLATIAGAPAAAALRAARAGLPAPVDPAAAAETARIAAAYIELIEDGSWFTPAREALAADFANMQETVNGVVRLRCHQGACRVVSGPASDTVAARGCDG